VDESATGSTNLFLEPVRSSPNRESAAFPMGRAARTGTMGWTIGGGTMPETHPPTRSGLRAHPGDRLVIHPHHQGEPARDGEILEALGEGGGPPFRVRWEDSGSETSPFPGSDASVDHLVASRPARRRRKAATPAR
jgi:hypothetical protein